MACVPLALSSSSSFCSDSSADRGPLRVCLRADALMFGTFGEPSALDRAERIAYNALPATWGSPKGGDMWAHQYLQAVNQINAKYNDPHVWTHDGPDAQRYGLEPNFGCCTAK